MSCVRFGLLPKLNCNFHLSPGRGDIIVAGKIKLVSSPEGAILLRMDAESWRKYTVYGMRYVV